MTRSPLRIALLIAALAAMIAVPAAFAGKGGGGKPGGGGTTGGTTLTLVPMDGATQAEHYGRVTFSFTTSTDRPFVGLRCYQGSNWVYDGYTGYFADYLFDPWFTLDSPYWTAGQAATCNARLFYFDSRGREVVLGTMGFAVAA